MKTAYVLLSGGIDSSTCVTRAFNEHGHGHVKCVSMDYGQRHKKELEFAAKVAKFYGLQHHVIQIPTIPKTMLTDQQSEVPNMSYSDIKGVSPTYVPFRNGLMLSTLAAFVAGELQNEKNEIEDDQDILLEGDRAYIYFGAHAEDAAGWAYPDCTLEFVGAMANAIYVGTYHKVRLLTPFILLGKQEIVKYGSENGTPYHLTWSCYKGEDLHCGTCPTCRARHDSFVRAKAVDPTDYAQTPLAA